MSDNHHLLRRDGRYYYRRRVPEDVVAGVGLRVIKFSLHTSDKGKAKQARAVADVEWDARFEAVRVSQAKPVIRRETETRAGVAETAMIVQRVRDFVERRSAIVTARLAADGPADEAERHDLIADAGIGLQALRNLDDPNGAAWVDEVARKIAAENNLVSNAKLDGYVRRALMEVQNRKLAALQSRHDLLFFDQLFDPRGQPDVTFAEIADQYATEQRATAAANDRGGQRVDQVQNYVHLLKEIVGATTRVQSVDYDVCLRVRSTLARVPLNRTAVYRGSSLERAIELADTEHRRRLSPLTQKQYLAAFKGILDLAAKKRLIPMNFAHDLAPVKRDTVPRGEKRDPFSQDQIREFFVSGFYAAAAQAKTPFAVDDDGWRFWLPLLTLFMGLRPNEACQLVAADLKRTKTGTWYLDLVETDDVLEDDGTPRKTLKTASSRRRVPLHPELAAIGFVGFVETRKKVKDQRLFPSLKPNRYGNLAWYAMKRFNEAFLPKALGLGPKQSFYSFRHSFRDALRRAEASDDVLHALGWSQGNKVSDHYGERSNPDWLAKFMPKIGFEGLTLMHLRPQPDAQSPVADCS